MSDGSFIGSERSNVGTLWRDALFSYLLYLTWFVTSAPLSFINYGFIQPLTDRKGHKVSNWYLHGTHQSWRRTFCSNQNGQLYGPLLKTTPSIRPQRSGWKIFDPSKTRLIDVKWWNIRNPRGILLIGENYPRWPFSMLGVKNFDPPKTHLVVIKLWKNTQSESHFVDLWKLPPLAALKGWGEKSSTPHQRIFSM